MKLRFAFVLCWCAAAMAQPWGPYEITSATDSLQNFHSPQVAIIDTQTARVFYTLDVPGRSEMRTFLYDLRNHQIIGTPELVRSDSVSQNLLDAAVDGADGWVLIYNRRYDAIYVDTKYLIGHAANRRDGYMGTTGYPNSPHAPNHHLSDFDLVARVGGGWILTWVQVTSPPPWYEDGSQIYVAGLSVDSMEYSRQLIPTQYELFGPYLASAVSVSPETSLVLTQRIWGLVEQSYCTLLRAVAHADTEVLDTVCTFDCRIDPLSFRRAANGSLLAYADPNVLLRVNESRECEVIGSLLSNYYPGKLTFQEMYGYAGLWLNPSWIQMGRMGVDGTGREPGVFYWRDNEHTVRDAAVAIAADGRIYVVWTEGLDGVSAATRLMISRINWDTPLSSPRVSRPAPAQFGLSAYPNPFNGTLRIAYELSSAQTVELSVHNVLGQKVASLYQGQQVSGRHELLWTPQGAGGLYFIALRAGDAVKTEKVLYLK